MTLVVGLSGGIGSGKSTVAGIFRELGAEVFDADALAHRELEKPESLQAIRQHFGPDVFNADGALDRRLLGAKVFGDPTERIWLESLVHPGVRWAIEAGLKACTSPVAVLDVPLLERSPLKALCQEVVFLKVPEDMRWERLKGRGWTKDHWQSRETAQTALTEKEKGASFVLDASHPLPELKTRIEGWLRKKIRIS